MSETATSRQNQESKSSASYTISVVASLTGLHAQTLRQYDRLGLVRPSRTKGRNRRYSAEDVRRLREVQRLSQEEGVNLAGIRLALDLVDQIRNLEDEVQHLRRIVRESSVSPRRMFTADSEGKVRLRPHRVRGAEISAQGRELTIDNRSDAWQALIRAYIENQARLRREDGKSDA